jgi:hypothetical protein
MLAKTYLTVPYAQKDDAKALGAKWDPAHKKWYVPTGLDVTLFSAWQSKVIEGQAVTNNTPSIVKLPSTSSRVSDKVTGEGTMTYSLAKDFVAYQGEAPPW